jgi:3-hydroxyisobutyrate dehydrogenase-like beta-hydroxyacid dehydrogenase
MKLPETSIIGIGGLGAVLTQTLLAKEIPVKSVFNRTEKKAGELAVASGIEVWDTFPSRLDDLGNLVFITVSDNAIE